MSAPTRNEYPGVEDFIVEQVRATATQMIRKFTWMDRDRDDIEQQLMIAALRSKAAYDSSKGEMSHYVAVSIANEKKRIYGYTWALKRDPKKISTSIDAREVEPLDFGHERLYGETLNVDATRMKQLMTEREHLLTEKQRTILKLVIEVGVKETAKRMSLHRGAIWWNVQRAAARLRSEEIPKSITTLATHKRWHSKEGAKEPDCPYCIDPPIQPTCACGCGTLLPIKEKARRFVHGHNARVSPPNPPKRNEERSKPRAKGVQERGDEFSGSYRFRKNAAYRRRCRSNGLCPHCGKPCAPYFECRERREYKRMHHIAAKIAQIEAAKTKVERRASL